MDDEESLQLRCPYLESRRRVLQSQIQAILIDIKSIGGRLDKIRLSGLEADLIQAEADHRG